MEKKKIEKNKSKEKKKRAQKADAHFLSIIQLYYLQVFCYLLRTDVPALAANAPMLPYGFYFLLLFLFITLGPGIRRRPLRCRTGIIVLIVLGGTLSQIVS